MKYSVKYGTKNIEFNVEFKNRKTMSISVEPPKSINVVAPVGTSEQEIKGAVKSKGAWIFKNFLNLEILKVKELIENLLMENLLCIQEEITLYKFMQMKIYRMDQVLNYLEENFMFNVKEKNDELIKKAMEAQVQGKN